jgi:20S proteasome subunit alpha 2
MGDMNFSLTTFNKTGKLMQIEYALNRVNQGKMALGIRGNNSRETIFFITFPI